MSDQETTATAKPTKKKKVGLVCYACNSCDAAQLADRAEIRGGGWFIARNSRECRFYSDVGMFTRHDRAARTTATKTLASDLADARAGRVIAYRSRGFTGTPEQRIDIGRYTTVEQLVALASQAGPVKPIPPGKS